MTEALVSPTLLRWAREHLIEQGANRLEFVGRFTLDTPADIVAADIRAVLHDDTEAAAAANWEQYRHFSPFRNILVLLSLPSSTARGA